MFTYSDIFKDDVPEDTVFVLEHPSSYQPHFGNQNFLVNSSKYLFDNEYRMHGYESNRIKAPHRNLAVLGTRVRAYVAEPPPNELFDHWQRVLGTKPVRYADLGEPVPHVCLFPLQDLTTEQHAVDPDAHYHIYSKKFIAEIDCPQPAILSELQVPSVLKLGRSSGGNGTWIIQKEEDYHYWTEQIRQKMPYAECTLTELVQDIKYNVCCHMYLNRKGDTTWLAVTEQIIENGVIWIGAVMQMSRQEELKRLVRSTCEPVAAAMHARGFFGLFGIDVLVDGLGRQYVIDINPRILGSTPLVFTQLSLQNCGRIWEFAMFLTGIVTEAASIEALVQRAEAVCDGELIIYSIGEKDSNKYSCQIGVFGRSIAECRAIAAAF